MTKKQWVAPSAQLVQFAANEYVAACGTRTIYQFIANIFDKFLMVEGQGNGTPVYTDAMILTDSYTALEKYPLSDANSKNWNSFLTEAQKREAADSMVSTTKGGWTNQNKSQTIESTTQFNTVDGWYIDDLDDSWNILEWSSTKIWYDSANDQIYAGYTDSENRKASS